MNRNSRVLLSIGAILLGILCVAVVAHIKHDAAKTPAASNTGKEPNGLAATSDETVIAKQKSHLMSSTNAPSTEAAEDAAQLNKKFEAERNCFDGMRASEIAQHLLEFCATPEASQSSRAVDECKRVKDLFPNGKSRASSLAQADCASSESEISQQYFAATYAAAQAGNADAQLCMIDRDPGRFARIDQQMSPEDRQRLFDLSIQWVQKAIQRGDNRIVAYVAMNPDADYLTAGLPGLENSRDDPRMVEYSLFRLARMGATGSYADLIDGRIRGLTGDSINSVDDGGGNPAIVVSREDAAAGDAWAKETFARYFADSPTQDTVPDICSFPNSKAISGH